MPELETTTQQNTSQDDTELTGNFSRGYQYYSYTNHFNLPLEEKAQLKEIAQTVNELLLKKEAFEKRIIELIRERLPNAFKIRQLIYKDHSFWEDQVQFIAECVGLKFVDETPPTAQKPVKVDPYAMLRNHHELKSILNSGVLEKWEKRKVLGLPYKEPEEQKESA